MRGQQQILPGKSQRPQHPALRGVQVMHKPCEQGAGKAMAMVVFSVLVRDWKFLSGLSPCSHQRSLHFLQAGA